MRLLPIIIVVAAAGALANAQTAEPETDQVFFALAHNPDRLIALERQTATIHTSAKWVGIGATAKSTSEFKPGKSPVRLSSGTGEFVVRSPFARSSMDFTIFYVLRFLTSKGSKRELVIAKSHAYIGSASSTSNLAEGEVPVAITRYGEHSLRIVPTQPLRPGEYALSSRAAFLNLFCFGVDQ
jgi:hypothetical protein